jgi:hypothetical protein
MTERKWLDATDPGSMLRHLERTSEDRRKLRLFACACCRRTRSVLKSKETRNLLEMTELFADGLVRRGEVEKLREHWLRRLDTVVMGWRQRALASTTDLAMRWRLSEMARAVCGQVATAANRPEFELKQHGKLLRDIFGNPFRPVAFDPSWRTSTAIGIAATMYDSRDFAPMPILADALEDAGCDHPDVLAHCRGPGPHVRGCWVVDLVLGKA